MISKLELFNFKSFPNMSKYSILKLGKLSLLLGTNASGKSNIRDGLRFLNGAMQNYTLLEIMSEKRGIGGELLWRGIRGGVKDSLYNNCGVGGKFFVLAVSISNINKLRGNLNYHITVGLNKNIPSLMFESLQLGSDEIYNFHPDCSCNNAHDHEALIRNFKHANETVSIKITGKQLAEFNISIDKPIISDLLKFLDEQLLKHAFRVSHNFQTTRESYPIAGSLYVFRDSESEQKEMGDIQRTLYTLQSMRFFDLNPEAMRVPSLTGQTVLGEQGENLSSVLHAIREQADIKANLLEWLGALTPMDAIDFKFHTDPYTNKVLAILIESNGQETSLYSASDGTLRFLAILAALFSPTPASLYFFEEIENGIHPSRLYLLVELLEERAKSGIQIIATTHSPQLLSLVSQTTLENSSLIYRTGKPASSRIMPILEIPNIKEILEKQDIAKLYATGWFEDVMEFMQEDSQ